MMAQAAAQAARNARRNKNHHLADALQSSAQVHADLCRAVANPMNPDDMNDLEAADMAAAGVEDIAMSGGRAPTTAWRTPGSGSVSDARRVLDRLHQGAIRHGHPAAASGHRSDIAPLASTRTPGPRVGAAVSGKRSLFESRWG
jgi:hypothetical protein